MALFRNSHEKRLMLTGYIIYATVEIERKIDEFLANHFCASESKATQLKQVLLFTERITFDAKKDMVNSIVKNDYPIFIKENPNFINMLSHIAPHRNIFAHLDIDNTSSILSFKKYIGGELKLRSYDRRTLGLLEKNINEVSDILDSLIRETPPRS